jgi:hypothetical protein
VSTFSSIAASGRASGLSCDGILAIFQYGTPQWRSSLGTRDTLQPFLAFLAATEVGLRGRRPRQVVGEADDGGEEEDSSDEGGEYAGGEGVF